MSIDEVLVTAGFMCNGIDPMGKTISWALKLKDERHGSNHYILYNYGSGFIFNIVYVDYKRISFTELRNILIKYERLEVLEELVFNSHLFLS